MITIEKNAGTKIPVEVNGTRVCFDDDLDINLAKRQKDEPVHIDICYDRNHELAIGVANGWAYVAEIDIPAIEYVTTTSEVSTEDGEEGTVTTREALPLDMDKVTLSLWAIE